MPATKYQFYTVEQAAVLLRLHPETIRKFCRRHRIPFTRSGRRYLFTDANLEGYLKPRPMRGV